MTRERATDPIGFGSGISTDHKDGIRWVDYSNISWNPVFCKRCDICIEICPKNTLVLRNDAIIEEENCILCGLCERYCPDIAIEMLPWRSRRTQRRRAALDRGWTGPMRKLTQGNEAVFRGAIAAGASYYAGYPISPSTEILNVASGWAAEHPDFRFLQAEDEIASANAIIGASLAGAKSFTATSGPGFSLMQEAVGYAQKVGVPCVFVDVQRVGPATGMPTMPGQGDIMQVKYGSTGDYTPLAFYPNGVEEAFRVTVHAFNAAEESLSPVVVLSDTFVAHLNEVVDLDEAAATVERAPRTLVPLGKHEVGKPRFFAGVVMYEEGPNAGEPATADADEYLRQYYAAKHRHLEVAKRYALYEHGWNVDAKVLIICYGIVSRVASPLSAEYALFRPIRIHPILADELRAIGDRYEQIVCIEANDGQYADMVEVALRREVKRVPLLGGRISLEAVRDGLDRVLAGGPSEPPIPVAPTEHVERSPLGIG